MTHCEDQIKPPLERAFSEAIKITEDNGDCHLIVPFERADRDAIELWVINQGDKYLITDEGETYGMLYLSNINLDQERRAKRLSAIKERFDLDKARREVQIRTTEEHLGERILDAIQAIQAISYLSYTRQKYSITDFRSDVGDLLTEEGFYYTPNQPVEGYSEEHIIDFNIHEQAQPTYLETIHSENASSAKNMARRTAFKWSDIREVSNKAKMISVLDNENGEFDAETETILENWSDAYVPWSNRDQLASVITA